MTIEKKTSFRFCFIVLFMFLCYLSIQGNADADSTTHRTFQIENGNDDASEIKSNGYMILADSTIKLCYDTARSEEQIVGLRFANVDIPKNAVIRSAYLRFFTNNSNSTGPVTFTITGEAADNSASFTFETYNISDRTRTTTSKIWSPPDWNEPWVSKEIHKSADVSNIINEIVTRLDFDSGNAISLFIEGVGTNIRSTYSYDYNLAYSDRIRFARLIIEYDYLEPICLLTPSILNAASTHFLPDYSFAGYKWGAEAILNFDSSSPGLNYVDVTSFGAVANDGNDDTQSILDAVSAHRYTQGLVLLHFPAGRFILSDVIMIDRSDFVLQGEGNGPDGTVFCIEYPLSYLGIENLERSVRDGVQYDKYRDVISILNQYEDGLWPTTGGVPYSLYSWTGGFFYTRYNGNRYARQTIADVAAGAQRGDRVFTIENSNIPLFVGDLVRFEWANPADNSFLNYLLGPDPVAIGSEIYGASSGLVAQPVTVVAIDGNQITIQEPLIHDVGPGWTARIRTVFFNVNVGFENFSMEFPYDTKYGGHHLEDGYNGMYLTDLQHSWVRNVTIINSDSAILLDHCKNNTLEGVKTSGKEGHYSISFGRSYGLLARKFDLQSPAGHNPSFNTDSVMNVYSKGYIRTANVDQHNNLNHQNLFDFVSVEYTNNLFSHGGNSSVLPTSAMYNTFWNIEVEELPYNNLVGTCEDAPGARLIGIHSLGNLLSVSYNPNPYIEGLNTFLAVPSLYDYQLSKRLDNTKPTAQFDFTSNGCLTVEFTDLSYDHPSSWLWDFGDGYTSTQASPIHEYACSGVYTVNLTVGNRADSNTVTKDIVIKNTWGQHEPLGTSAQGPSARTIGGLIEKNIHLKSISMYLGGTGEVRLAVYSGGALNDPSDATLLWDAEKIAVNGTGWYKIDHPEGGLDISANTVLWLAWKKPSGIKYYYSGKASDAGDFQDTRGRTRNTFGTNPDISFPDVYGDGPDFSNYWYSIFINRYDFLRRVADAKSLLDERT